MEEVKYHVPLKRNTIGNDVKFKVVVPFFNGLKYLKNVLSRWTEHIIKYEDGKRPFDSMKKRRNFRFLKIGEPSGKDPETIHINEGGLRDLREINKNEKTMSDLGKR